MKNNQTKNAMLIVQCDKGDAKANLIACARHLCEEAREFYAEELACSLHIIFIVNLTRIAGGCKHLGSFHGVNWISVHIDELRPPSEDLPSLVCFADQNMSYLFCSGNNKNQNSNNSAEGIEASEQKDTDDHLAEKPNIETNESAPKVTSSLQLGLLKRCVQASIAKTMNHASELDAAGRPKRIQLLLNILSQDISLPGKYTYFSHSMFSS